MLISHPKNTDLIGMMSSLPIKIFNSSPGDSKMPQSLRTTDLKGKVKTNTGKASNLSLLNQSVKLGRLPISS